LPGIKKIVSSSSKEHPRALIKRHAHLVALVALSIALVTAFNVSRLNSLVRRAPKPSTTYADDINDYGKRLLKEAKVSGTFGFDQYGVSLKPGDYFTTEYNFSKGANQEVTLQLWFYTPLQGHGRVEVLCGNESQLRLSDPQLHGVPALDLTNALSDCTSFALRLSAEKNRSATQGPETVFDRIALTIANPRPLPPLDAMVGIVFFGMCAWWLGTWSGLRKEVALAVSAALVVVLSYLQFRAFRDIGVIAQIAFWTLFVACLSTYFIKNRRRALPPIMALLVLGICYVGSAQRWRLLNSVVHTPLEVDAISYRDLAVGMRGLFDTHYREPVFIWVVKVFSIVFPSGDLSLRLCTFSLSVLMILVLYFVGKKLFTPFVGLLAALFFATNTFMIESSARGLRGEIFMLTIVALIACLFRKSERFEIKDAIMLGVVAGLNNLNNLSFLSITVPLIVIVGAIRRWKATLLLLSLGISLVVLLPHLIQNKREFGDYFYTTNIHARYYRNLEFGGKPGFPSVDEIKQNSYAGTPLTTFAYFFGLHTFKDVLETSWNGFRNLYLTFYPQGYFFGNVALSYLYFAGMIMLFLSRKRWFLLGLFFGGYSVTFMAGRFVNFDWRLVMHVAPLMYLSAAFGVDRIVRFTIVQHNQGIESVPTVLGAPRQKGIVAKEKGGG
jgi:hypothetical protein